MFEVYKTKKIWLRKEVFLKKCKEEGPFSDPIYVENVCPKTMKWLVELRELAFLDKKGRMETKEVIDDMKEIDM